MNAEPSKANVYAAVEAGGTKFVCGVGDAAGGSRETRTIPTAGPDETLASVREFLREAATRYGPPAGLGIASFGPIGLDPARDDYGRLLATPKPGWRGTDMIAGLAGALGLPAGIDTDVNAAALAEARIGAARGAKTAAYVTVGTGIGVGLVVAGRTVRDSGHPELGHMLPRRHPAQDGFDGVCPFHRDCLEGLASGPAIAAAWGEPSSALNSDHPAWDAEADYLGQLCATLMLALAPERIVIGGGVMAAGALLPAIRARTAALLAGYLPRLENAAAFDALIVAPGCREPSGLTGAYLLAEAAGR